MGRVRSLVRWVVIGRRDGARASLRRATGCLTWLDRPKTSAAAPERSPLEPAAAPERSPEADPKPVPPTWRRLARADELPVGSVTEVAAGDRTLAIANVDGSLYAVDSTCPHAGGPLGEGQLAGHTLTCPWHGRSYDVRTGRSAIGESESVPTYPLSVSGGVVYLLPSAALRETSGASAE